MTHGAAAVISTAAWRAVVFSARSQEIQIQRR